jgi:predicted small integral membrane protein
MQVNNVIVICHFQTLTLTYILGFMLSSSDWFALSSLSTWFGLGVNVCINKVARNQDFDFNNKYGSSALI